MQSMTAPLRRVLVCSPKNAGWSDPAKFVQWQVLGFHHEPNFSKARSAHEILCRLMSEAGAEVLTLPATPQLTLDALYTHDASLPTDHGLILMRPGKPNRIPEARSQSEFLAQHGIATAAKIQAPATTEGGDLVWLDEHTLLVGQGYRTNQSGIDQLRSILTPHHVEVIKAPLPYGPGPCACLHLMSLMSMLDERTILVDLPWLAVETVELLRARNFRLIEIDHSERDTLACNVLSLGNRSLIALEENKKTNARLQSAGFEVRTIPGAELCINGAGGPTCLTRPLLRG
ncbi:MAG TPA: arginine deiminase family protein [Terriglobales bacterium]|nr:arginine deiminase family protein [Terriglobales bacterium]